MQERGLEPKDSTETGRNNANTFAGSGQNTSNRSNRNETEETLAMLENGKGYANRNKSNQK